MGHAATFRPETPGADRLAVLALACIAAATFTAGLRKQLDRPSRPETAKVVVMEVRTEAPRQWASLDATPPPAAERPRPRAAVARTVQAEAAAMNPAPSLQIATAETVALPAVATVDASVVPELPASAEPTAPSATPP